MAVLREKLKKLNDFLAGLPMTIVGGVFLLLSFILPRINNMSWQNLIHYHYYYMGRQVHGGAEIWGYLAWVTIVICGIPMLYLAIWRVIHNKGISKISSALLISIAMVAAILIGDYFAAGEVAFIMAIGAILEDMTTERARKGLHNLIKLTPKTARVLKGEAEEMVEASEVKIGDILRVLPGESIPADGIILKGETSIDQSIMTGESLPVDKTVNDPVFCGTMNRFGSFDMRVTASDEASSLHRLIRMVEEADKKQAPVQRIADRWASYLVPAASLIAVAAYFLTGDISRMVTVLVVFCPCALVLATPTAIMAAIGQATKHGVIIKSGEALEKLGKTRRIAFDKTGTLTRGALSVADISALPGTDEEEVLQKAASCEERSEHPLGRAITAFAREKEIKLLPAENFAMAAGRGVSVTAQGQEILCGSASYLAERGVAVSEQAEEKAAAYRAQGQVPVLVAWDGAARGLVALADTMRPQARDMVEALKAMGAHPVLLTGDHPETAQAVAGAAGIEEVHAGLLPEDKVAMVSRLKEDGMVCMIGDGVNDAPALKTADVGVAMGCMGSDIAVEAADVALMTDDLSKIPYLKRLSNATVRTIHTCITVSMCINAAAVTLSVLGLLTPTTGALVHNAGSTFVVLMAALLYDRKFV